MRKVQRTEIVDYQSYADKREQLRPEVLREKEERRLHLGDALTFLFETTDTIRYQIQEMMRIERIVREADIQHEIDTYNEVLGAQGELGCTLLIEIDDPQARDVKLRAWRDLPKYIYLELQNGERARAQWDERQVGDERLSSVQYLKFRVGQSVPVTIGVDHPELTEQTQLTERQRSVLHHDATAA